MTNYVRPECEFETDKSVKNCGYCGSPVTAAAFGDDFEAAEEISAQDILPETNTAAESSLWAPYEEELSEIASPIREYPDELSWEKTTRRKGRSFASVTLSIILSLFVIALAGVLMVTLYLRFTLTEPGILALMEDVRLSRLTVYDLTLDDSYGSRGLTEYISRSMAENNGGIDIIPANDLGDILDGTAVKSFIACEAAAIIDDIERGTVGSSVTSEDAARLVDGLDLSDAEKDAVAAYLYDDFLGGISTEDIMESSPEAYYSLHLGLSWLAVGVLSFLLFIFTVLYFAVNRRVVGDAFIGIGSAIMTAALPFVAGGVVYRSVPAIWRYLFGNIFILYWPAGAFLELWLGVSALIAACGFILVLAGMINNGILKRRVSSE